MTSSANKLSSARYPLGLRLFLSLILMAALAASWIAIRALAADVLTMQARWQVVQWQRTPGTIPAAADLGRVRNQLVAGLAWTPGDPQLLENLGYIYGLRAVRAARLPELQRPMLDEAIANFRQALNRRPMSPYTWVNLATALEMRDGTSAELWFAFDRAWLYGQREGGVQIRLLQIALRHWSTELGVERQNHIRHMVSESRGKTRREILRLLKVLKREDLLPAPTPK